ncbi:hypothetical protein PPRY_a2059 [Pseudoalteromonas prydzensis ACAM 620]|nr:hypothetical protein [Pseudoalteromonas prydzensis ACAM 620]
MLNAVGFFISLPNYNLEKLGCELLLYSMIELSEKTMLKCTQ